MGFGPNYSLADVPGTPEYRIAELEAENARLRDALQDLLNDCINFGGDSLSDWALKKAAKALQGGE